jgi:RNA polymerase sigma factor (sigma-70 family)
MSPPPSLANNEWYTTIATAFDEYYGLFFVRAKAIVHSGDDAYDIVMDVFLRLLVNEPTEEIRHVTAFIVKAITNAALDYKDKKKPKLVEDAWKPWPKHLTGEQAYESKQMLEVCVAKADLTEAQKVLWQYIQQEYSNAEIADLFGQDSDSIRQQKYVLFRKLRKEGVKL